MRLFLIFFLFSTHLNAQNLVPDPSFEMRTTADSSFTTVDTGITTTNLSIFYQQPKILTYWSSPTYVNSGIMDALNSPPSVWGQTQLPYDDNIMGYIRLYNYGSNQFGTFAESRSYLQTQLSDTLMVGRLYKVSFYISFTTSQNNPLANYYSSSSIGAYLSPNRITQFRRPFEGDSSVINVTPQITNHPDSFFSDSSKWNRVCDLYRATGGEQWLTIGNFYNDANTKLRLVKQGLPSTIGYDDTHYFIDYVSVEEVKLIQPNIKERDTILCSGVNFTKILRAPKGAISYLWSNNAITDSIVVDSIGTYWLNADYGCGIESDTFKIKAYPTLQLNLGADLEQCGNKDSILLVANAGFSSYHWSNGDTTSSIWVKSSGSYSLIAAYPCDTLLDTVNVTFKPIPSPPLVSDTGYCKDSIVQLSANGLNLLWYDSIADPNPSPAFPSILNETIGSNFYYVTQTVNGCESSIATFSVKTEKFITTNLGNDLTLCGQDSLLIGVINQNNNYLWNTNETNSRITVKTSGQYWLQASNFCNSSTDTIQIQFNSKPPPPIVSNSKFCNPTLLTQADLNAIGVNLLWYSNFLDSVGRTEPNFSTPQLDGIKTFYVSQTIDNCESERVSFTVDIQSKPHIEFNGDTTICDDKSIILYVPSNAETFNWIPFSNDRSLSVNTNGTFHLFAENFCGTDSDSIIVKVINCSTIIDVPNVFTPNNDGMNDRFAPFGENYTLQEILIFNRWGQQIFTDQIPWDGKIGGKNANSGTYFYIIKITDANNETQIFRGNLSLIW